MFTVCPKCALTLVVTAGDLRVGQGYVRCGRCSNVFNALVGLSEERQAALTGQPPPGPPASTHDAAVPPAELPRELTDEPDADAVPDSALEFDPDSADLAEVFVEPRPGPHDVTSGTFETIVLDSNELPRIAANDGDAQPEPAANDALLEEEPSAEANDSAAFDRARIESPRPRGAAVASASEPATAEAVAASLAGVGTRRSRRSTFAWGAGIAIAALLLAAQVVHHYRDRLAIDARFREPLTALYETLGLSLEPRWNLAGYDVRQLGASAEGGTRGVLTVRASVQNSGEHPQPLPLLRVTVQDRFGNRIAARDVRPDAYAERAAAISRYLEVGERVDAEIRLADPGPEAVGFELDACLPVQSGRIACASEHRTR